MCNYKPMMLAMSDAERDRLWEYQYLCYPQPPDKRLLELAVEYHGRCEAYERLVFSGPIVDGQIIPGDLREIAKSSRYAIRVRDEIVSRGKVMGFSALEIHIAICDACQFVEHNASMKQLNIDADEDKDAAAYKSGYQAGQDGKSYYDNPYQLDPPTVEARRWIDGMVQAGIDKRKQDHGQ